MGGEPEVAPRDVVEVAHDHYFEARFPCSSEHLHELPVEVCGRFPAPSTPRTGWLIYADEAQSST